MQSKRFTLRFNPKQYQKLLDESDDYGINLSELIRYKLGLENKSDIRKVVFLLNKTSNNINQIAKGINIANLANRVDDFTYSQILARLSIIQNDFKTFYELIKNVD